MIIEWFSILLFLLGLVGPRKGTSGRRKRLIYVSLHKSWIIILLYGLSHSAFPSHPRFSAALLVEILLALRSVTGRNQLSINTVIFIIIIISSWSWLCCEVGCQGSLEEIDVRRCSLAGTELLCGSRFQSFQSKMACWKRNQKIQTQKKAMQFIWSDLAFGRSFMYGWLRNELPSQLLFADVLFSRLLPRLEPGNRKQVILL